MRFWNCYRPLVFRSTMMKSPTLAAVKPGTRPGAILPADRPAPQPRLSMSANFECESFVIRPFQPADAVPMYEAARESHEQLCRWMTWCRPGYDLADAQIFVSRCPAAWASGEHYSFAILDRYTRRFLGSVALNQLNKLHQQASVGYWVRDSAVGRGAAASATRLVARFAFHELGMRRLEFLIPLTNAASQRVAQKVGAKLEASLRSRLLVNGVRHDAALYALLPEDLAED